MRSLMNEGVDTIFGYPGGSIMPVFDAMYDHREDFRQVVIRHEQGAAHAAQGYARSSGKVGVCIVTSGPGATNTLTGISDAILDSTPIVVIAGQVSSAVLGTDAFQEIQEVRKKGTPAPHGRYKSRTQYRGKAEAFSFLFLCNQAQRDCLR